MGVNEGLMDKMSQLQDHDVINQVLQGDHRAYRILVDRYKHMVFTLAIRLVKNREDAEEVTQDAFMKAFRGLAAFKGSAMFSTWMYKIAYRAALDHLKKRKREPYTTPVQDAKLANKYAQDPAAPIEAKERAERIKRAIDSLPGDIGNLMIFFYYEELSLREIAQITGKSQNAIKVGLHRGRKRLAETLTDVLETKSESYASSR